MSKSKNTNIITLAGEFKNIIELKTFCDQLYKDFELVLKENATLKERLGGSGALDSAPMTDEEAICLQQINSLKRIAMTRDLSLDEVKKLDLLHKNIRLARGESTSNFGKMKDVTGSIPTTALIAIATANDATDNK